MRDLIGFSFCLEWGLLRRVLFFREKVLLSIKRVEEWLEEVKRNREFGLYRIFLMVFYFVMFYVVRVVFFCDGWWEKSYYCVVRYFEEFYVKIGKFEGYWVEFFDRMREFRYED